MNKTARHVFRLYVIAAKVRRFPINATRTCYSQIAAFPYSSNSKDHELPVTYGTKNQENNDIAFILSEAKTSQEILQIVKQYHPVIKSTHSLQALKLLDSMYRQKGLTNSWIGKNIEFLRLCEVLINDIKSLSVDDALYVLKICRYFGIPSTSVVSQSMLQCIRRSLSHLSFHSLMDLEFLLKDFESTPLSDALLIAIPMMCTIQLDNKMIDLTSTSNLISALIFLNLKQSNCETTEMIINALREKGPNIQVRHAKKILQHMCDLKYLPPGYEEVLANSQQILTQNMYQLSAFNIQVLLGKIVKQVHHLGNQTFYNEEYIDACAKTVISKDFGFKIGVRVLKLLCSLNHTHIRLIDYLAAKCFENPEVLRKSFQLDIMSLVISLAMADYKPIFWESMQETILENVDKKNSGTEFIYLNFAISMAVLDFFDVGLIKKVFGRNYLQAQLQRKKSDTYWHLLLLYQSIKTSCPTYTGPWPPQHMLDAAMNDNSFVGDKPSLLPALEKALGGSQYILSNLRSKIGHQIDHVVVMRKGGYPVALNSLPELSENESIRYIEELQLPVESQVIIIINLPASAYAINSRRLKGKWRLLLDALETHTTHTVIPINSMMWNALMDREKIPYLMQAIRLKCDSMSASANV